MLTDLLQIDVVIVYEDGLGRGIQICWLIDKAMLLLRSNLGIAIQRSHFGIGLRVEEVRRELIVDYRWLFLFDSTQVAKSIVSNFD